MMKWKCGAAAAVLAALLAGSAGADFVQTDDTTLTVPEDVNKSIHADFKEGKKTVRFAAGRTYDGKLTVLEVLDKKNIAWKVEDKLPRPNSYQAYVIRQYRDTETDRYFYGVSCFYTMDSTYHAYLLGFDKDKKKFCQYIDSDNFPGGKTGNVSFTIADSDLLLYTKQPWEAPLLYKLNWSEESQWFGYEYQPERKLSPPKSTKSDAEMYNKQYQEIFYNIAYPGAPVTFSQDFVKIRVGQQVRFRPQQGSADPGYSPRWMGRGNPSVFEYIDTKGMGKTFPKGSTELLVTGKKPGRGALTLVPNYGEWERACKITIIVIE